MRFTIRRFILAACFMFIASPLWAAWANVNKATKGWGTQNPSSTAAFSNHLTSGSIITVGVFTGATSASTPYDTAGNTYVDCGAGPAVFYASSWSVQVFYALNTHTTSSNVVSIANPSGYFMAIAASEWTGGATSSPIDVYSTSALNATTGYGGGQNETTGAAATTVDGDLIYGFSFSYAGTSTTGTGFTLLNSVSTTIMDEYQIQASHASIAATWSSNANANSYGAVMAAFKLYGAGVSGPRHRVVMK